jgi:hypothetical protein
VAARNGAWKSCSGAATSANAHGKTHGGVVNVNELRELLGKDVVLLGWPIRTKGSRKKWSHLTAASMTPGYLKNLAGGNIGVALGAKSGNLVALDVDTDELVEPFLSLNPFLKSTLQTHGARGRVFWFRMAGDYPAKTVRLKNHSGDDCGEFRSNGSQSIIHGIHPNGNAYEVVNMVKPLVVDFTSIIWPDEISNPPRLETKLLVNDTETQSYRVTEKPSHRETDVTDETDAIGCASVLVSKALSSPFVGASGSDSHPAPFDKKNVDLSKLSVADAVALAMPSRIHQNNDQLFILGRAVKRLESNSGQTFTPAQLREVFTEWHGQALPFLRKEKTRDDYMIQFMNAYKSAKIPLGEDGVKMAWKRVQENPLPPEAIGHFEDDNKRRLVALCRELQIIHGQQPFFLSARTVQQLFKMESHIEPARWLRSFCVLKILNEVEKGKGVRASRYRFNFSNN